ncbi:MAG: galactose mutarotase [Propionibacteriaceae bacterium]|nr:galactose mutarotase [Propionibacteriaceae bacterium]
MEKVILGRDDFTVEIWSRGACVNDICMPDRHGRISSVVLGYATEEDRIASSGYFGEIVGPFGNRIAAGGYEIDGRRYTPDLNNNGVATLHGGSHGFSYQDWEVAQVDDQSLTLSLSWSDPNEGFPGPIHVKVAYVLEGWSLTHKVIATTEVPTVISIVSHPYFNLSGGSETIDGHLLQVGASQYLPVNKNLIPLPEAPVAVDGTPFDFRGSRLLGEAFAEPDPQVIATGGIDHALILNGSGMRQVALLRHQESGRELIFHTDYPALQIYTGHMMTNPRISHPEGAGGKGTGIALETEEYPDAPRRPDFPSTILRPGEEYCRTTTWEFRVG